MKKLLPILGILLIGAALFFLYKNTPEKVGMKNVSPDLSIEAASLYADFAEDESLANENYLNKVVLVSGTVKETVGSQNGSMPMLRLDTGNKEGSVICAFDANTEHGKMEFHLGEKVTLKCICMDYYQDVKLSGCVME